MRVVLLWPEGATLPQAIRAAVPVAVAQVPVSAATPPRRRALPPPPVEPPRRAATPPAAPPALPGLRPAGIDPRRVELALLALAGFGPTLAAAPAPTVPGMTLPPERPRASFSAWAMARGGTATGGPVQLGGGQAGVRMRLPMARDSRFVWAGRVATPLSGPGREAALGVEWRPLAAPVALVAERRVALDGGEGGTGLGAIGGIDRGGLPGGFDLEAYGQAGAVARRRIEPYADGAVRLLHPVAAHGKLRLRLGIGGWGGAQRDARRIDIGPTAVVALPIGRVPVRLSIDWRQRIGGDAAPGSGPAVTLGSDF